MIPGESDCSISKERSNLKECLSISLSWNMGIDLSFKGTLITKLQNFWKMTGWQKRVLRNWMIRSIRKLLWERRKRRFLTIESLKNPELHHKELEGPEEATMIWMLSQLDQLDPECLEQVKYQRNLRVLVFKEDNLMEWAWHQVRFKRAKCILN